MRTAFLIILALLTAVSGTAYFLDRGSLVWFIIPGIALLLAIYNALQKEHTILRNFPLLGYFRYGFEAIAPEIQQYFIERNTDGSPFSRNMRSLAYRRAKNVMDTHPFGTMLNLNETSYQGLGHSMYIEHQNGEAPRITIGGRHCAQPYNASLFNISAMSYGSLSSRAIEALNKGAARGGFFHNTGEGSISDFHLKGGDLVWQIGTGYFGCRTEDGNFSAEKFAEKAQWEAVKMIEIKISQGAKPGHGGVLPASKNNLQIARIRGIKPHTTVLSPPSHSTFSDAHGLLDFIQQLRELSGGKPVGIKLCIGRTEEFEQLCEVMQERQNYPDFITVDGAEGGTGAAPPEFSDSVGYPLQPGLIFVHKTLQRYNLREEIKIIASGKVLSGAAFLKTMALGADLCNNARGFMFALGCIQALRCNTNSCPTGVATMKKQLVGGLVVEDKAERVYHFHRNTVKSIMEMTRAAGRSHPNEICHADFVEGDFLGTMEDKYFNEGELHARS